MGQPLKPQPAKLVVGLLVQSRDLQAEAVRLLEEAFGPIDAISRETVFDQTDFYQAEMGPNLLRRWVSHLDLVDPGQLAEIKLRTNDLETRLAGRDGRRVNLDPGLLSLTRLVLASTKEADHRVYLGGGVWAEVTLRYRAGRWEPLPWTYADYAAGPLTELLPGLRERYRGQLRLCKEGK